MPAHRGAPAYQAYYGRKNSAFCLLCCGNIFAVLDDHSLGSLGDFAVLVPCHVGAGQAVEGHGGELLNHGCADICVAHVSCDTCSFAGLGQSVDAVISVCRELVGDFAVGACLVVLNEGLGLLVFRVCHERSQQIDALGQGSVETFQIKDAVHAEVSKPSTPRIPSMPSTPKTVGLEPILSAWVRIWEAGV